MSLLIIENGTNVEYANSYITIEQADAYLVVRGLWDATPVITDDTDPDNVIETLDADTLLRKEQAIIKACDFLNTLFWKGEKVFPDTVLALPRYFTQADKDAEEQYYSNPEFETPEPPETDGNTDENTETDDSMASGAIVEAVEDVAEVIKPYQHPIAKQIIYAQAEASALYYSGVDLLASSQQGITSESSSVDVISESYTYASDKPQYTFYPRIMGLLRPYLAHVQGEKESSFNVVKGVLA